MVKRIITAAVCLVLFIPTLVFSGKVPLLFMSVIGVLALISAYEICGCIGVRKAFYVSLPTYLTVIAVMALSIVYVKQYQAIPLKMFASLILAILFIYLFVTFSASMFSDGGVRFSQTCEMTAFTMYMLIGYLAIIFTRYADMGNYLFLLIFIGVWLTDTGAYFVGSFLGKHKLIPN
ncbi:MAG: phosphatidate cytidylyltransferase, partial [Clostridiales bacterium]|nr:phosphatidate cytidylyltransferase [Clostridiales bacterium]